MTREELATKLLRRLMARDAVAWAREFKRHPSIEAVAVIAEWKDEIKRKATTVPGPVPPA